MPSKDCTAPRNYQQGITFGSTIVIAFHYFIIFQTFLFSFTQELATTTVCYTVKNFAIPQGKKRTINAIQSATVPIASSHFSSMVTAPNINPP